MGHDFATKRHPGVEKAVREIFKEDFDVIEEGAIWWVRRNI